MKKAVVTEGSTPWPGKRIAESLRRAAATSLFLLALAALAACSGTTETINERENASSEQQRAPVNGEPDTQTVLAVELAPEDIALIRNAVFEGDLITYYERVGMGNIRTVGVPRELESLFEQHGNDVVRHLLWIARYGRPLEALKAIAYANALAGFGSIGAELAMKGNAPELIDIPKYNGATLREREIASLEDWLDASQAR